MRRAMLSRRTIPSVEDAATRLAAMAARFEVETSRVLCASDGAERQRALDRRGVVLIGLDLRLPGEGGRTRLRALRSRSDVPVIVVGSRSDGIDRILASETGADDCRERPVNLCGLLLRSRNILRRCAPAGGRARASAAGCWTPTPAA